MSIRLKDYINNSKRSEWKKLSKTLNDGNGDNKLDCSEVYSLSKAQLEDLFSHIRPQWKNWVQLHNFIDTNTFEDIAQQGLQIQIKNFLQQSHKQTLPWKLIKVSIVVVVLGLAVLGYLLFKQGKIISCKNPNYTRINWLEKCYKDFSKTPLTIGILTEEKYYQEFRKYLQDNLVKEGITVKDIKIETINECYNIARNKIADKTWDLVFAYSPINSMAANDNGYLWIARMFPDKPEYYQSALYVRKESEINSIQDIKPSHKVALGCIGSASSFYMPIYQLYGKTVNLSSDNRYAYKLVSSGLADVGAMSASFIDESKFKIINLSHNIPGSGVYLSPELSPQMQDTIKKIMLAAPDELKKQANYGEGKEPDWQQFRIIATKSENIIQCRNLKENPVKLDGCKCSKTQIKGGLEGRVNGFTLLGSDQVQLNIDGDNGQKYSLNISLKILNQVPNGISPILINNKKVIIQDIDLKSVESKPIQINKPKQITVLLGC